MSDSACQEAADIVFVVDSSSSIYRRDFDVHMKQFINDVVASFTVGPGVKDTRVGMVSFGNRAYLQFYLNSYQVSLLLVFFIGEIDYVSTYNS